MIDTQQTSTPDIRQLLKSQGRSLDFAARFLKVHPNSMRAIAARIVIPRLDRAAKLSVLVGCPLEQIYPEFFTPTDLSADPS